VDLKKLTPGEMTIGVSGVLLLIFSFFNWYDVSIKSVLQEGRGDEATLMIVTHLATEAQQRAARHGVEQLGNVRSVASVVRVESPDK